MRILFCLILSTVALNSFAQDFPDYRSKRDNFLKMQEKDIRAEIASFAMGGLDESVGKLPLQTVPLKNVGEDYITFEGKDIKVIVTRGVFTAGKKKLNYYDEKYLVKIDNKPFYGSFGKLPKTTIDKVIVIMNNDTIPVPPAAYADLYNPSFTYRDASGTQRTLNSVYLSNDKRKVYIYLLNKDEAGSYEVTWVIQDKKYLRRVIDYGFMK
jgi:hypothetical protein